MDNKKKKKCTDYDQYPEGKPEQKITPCAGLSFFIQLDTVGHSLLNFLPPASMATCSSWFSPLSQSPFKGQTCILLSSPWWLLLSLLSSYFLQFYSSISAAASQACVLTAFVTVPLGWPKGAPKQVSKMNLLVPQTCSSSFSHTTVHQSAQDKFCSHPELSPHPPVLTLKRNWGLSTLPLSLDSVFFSPVPLSPSEPELWTTCFLDYCNHRTRLSASDLPSFQSILRAQSFFKHSWTLQGQPIILHRKFKLLSILYKAFGDSAILAHILVPSPATASVLSYISCTPTST